MNSSAHGNGSRDPREEQSPQQDPRSAATTTTTKKDCGLMVTPAEYSHILKFLSKVIADKTGEKFDG